MTVNGRRQTIVKTLPFISAGTLRSAADPRPQRALGSAAAQASSARAGSGPAPGLTLNTLGCAGRTSHRDVRVNQDCGYRLQSEEGITYNPLDANNLLAGQNDERQGRNQCGIDYSLDDGRHWGDQLPPFQAWRNDPVDQQPTAADPNRNTIAGDAGTFGIYQRASDPALAFDSRGRAFFSCVTFDSNTNASGLFAVPSPPGAKGSYFFNIDTGTQPNNRPILRKYKVVEDNSFNVFHDKNFIAADSFTHSPNRDNVHVTWTVFFADNAGNTLRSPIYGSMSTDHALTWSTPQEISGNSSALCFGGNTFDHTQPAHQCNNDQGSDPTVLPNGDLAVVFNNGNTAPTNPNSQQLALHCHPTGSSSNGTAHLNCGAPTRIGADVTQNEPTCNFGRGPEECIPGNFIRTDDYPRIGERRSNGHLYTTWQDYRHGEYDIELAESVDGGRHWSSTRRVNSRAPMDYYEAAVAVAQQRGGPDRVGVSYYRTRRVPRESTTPAGGFAPPQPGVQRRNSEYLLAGGVTQNTPYKQQVVSPTFRPPDGDQFGFLGDYSGLTINHGLEAHPIWADTRNKDPLFPQNGVLHDQDIFSTAVRLPRR